MNIQQYYWYIFPFVVFDVILKGFSLWFAARAQQKYWFIALLLINSLGILPLVYLAFFAKSEELEKFKKKIFRKRK